MSKQNSAPRPRAGGGKGPVRVSRARALGGSLWTAKIQRGEAPHDWQPYPEV